MAILVKEGAFCWGMVNADAPARRRERTASFMVAIITGKWLCTSTCSMQTKRDGIDKSRIRVKEGRGAREKAKLCTEHLATKVQGTKVCTTST